MTTPSEARAIADMLQTDIPAGAVEAFRSLADQVEALTAQLDSYAMALNETKAERDSYKKDAERYRWLRDTNCNFSIRSPREYWEPLQVPAIFFGHEMENWHLFDGVCTAWTGSEFDAAMDRAINADDETKRGWKEANSGGIPMRIKSVNPSLLRAAIAKGAACKGFEIEPGVFSGCNQSAGDCPACGK